MNQITKMGVYLRHTQLKIIKTKVIVTLYRSHSFYTQREDAQLELQKRIKHTSGNDCPPFILTPGLHTHSPPSHYTRENPVIKQDTILVECEIQHADQVLELLFTALINNDKKKWPITGCLQLIPIRPFGKMNKDFIDTYAMNTKPVCRISQTLYLKRLSKYRWTSKNFQRQQHHSMALSSIF